ncbi:MAG: radical SAM protein [Synergistaceae bacterium]|jgi:pyruvate formate lyase activating enzyme|nr:radical SAM protein [Synergistaceae bacterium]
MTEPAWWRPADGGASAVCSLCFRECRIKKGSAGFCKARKYTEGGFVSPHLGRFVSVAVDPIEKKPLRRWRPGTQILSLGSIRCDMTCPFCQNHAIAHPLGNMRERAIEPWQLAEMARSCSLKAVAYTYNEPTLQAEYIIETSVILKKEGIATVMVTNGMFGEAFCEDAARCVDAMNIDIKTFDDEKYARLGGSLETVTRNVKHLVDAGVHIELTNLVVPGISDSEEDFIRMISWIASVSHRVPLHISRYFPAYQYYEDPTDPALMLRFRDIAGARLKFVYMGNLP